MPRIRPCFTMPKSPTCRSHQSNSPFEKSKEIWIALTFQVVLLFTVSSLLNLNFFTMPMFPTSRPRQSNSPFEQSKEIWIILNSQNESIIEISRAYLAFLAFSFLGFQVQQNKQTFKCIPFHTRINSNSLSIVSRVRAESRVRAAIQPFLCGRQKTSVVSWSF